MLVKKKRFPSSQHRTRDHSFLAFSGHLFLQNSVASKDSMPSKNISQDIGVYSEGLCASYAKRDPSDTVTVATLQDPALYPEQPSETSTDGSDSDADWDVNEPFMPFEMDCSVDAFEE